MALPVSAADTAGLRSHRTCTGHPACDSPEAISHAYAIPKSLPNAYGVSQPYAYPYAGSKSYTNTGWF